MGHAMTDSILDSKPSHVLHFPLTLKQQIWLQFIAPGVITSLLYIVTIATDITVGIAFIFERQIVPGIVTLSLVYVPAAVCFILQLSSFTLPQPWSVKSVIVWFLKELLYFIIFPLRTIQSLGELMFWLVEAAHGKGNVEESLRGSHSALPQSVHIYLFLQPFLQCAPQAILQIHLLLLHISRDVATERAQIFCVVCSLATVALSVAFYHRYESQCVSGRAAVLHKNAYEEVTKDDNESSFKTNSDKTTSLQEDNPVRTTVAFLAWFFFLLARILSLVISNYYHPYITLAIISLHYIVMLVYFLTLKSSNCFKKLCISFIAILCLVEVSVKFKRVTILYCIFFLSCISENVGLTVYWFVFSKWSGWWFHYIIYTMIIAHLLAIIFFIIYSFLFHPKAIKKSKSTAV